MASKLTQLVNERLGLAEAAAASGNFAAAVNYANAALPYSRSDASTANINKIIAAYTQARDSQGTATGGTPGPNGDSTPTTATDPMADYYAAMKRDQQNTMIAVMREFMTQNGMGDLLQGMEKYVRQGYSGDSVYVMLKNDPSYQAAYNKRFAANADRVKKGLPELSPAAYIELEQGYRTAMLVRGMPSGLFDSPDDFTNLIKGDVSVREVEARLDGALEYINFDGNSEVKKQLRDIYGMTDGQMAAYVLDPTRTLDYLSREIDKNLRRASVGGAAVNSGVSTSLRDQIAEILASQSADQAYATSMQGFGSVAQQEPLYSKLGALSGVQTNTDELVTEQFSLEGSGDVTNKKKLLASQERARFSGMSGLSAGSLSAGRKVQ